MHATIAKLAIDWLSVIPFTIHPLVQFALMAELQSVVVIVSAASYGAIVNYITIARASSFFAKFFEAIYLRSNMKSLLEGKVGDREAAITRGRRVRSLGLLRFCLRQW